MRASGASGDGAGEGGTVPLADVRSAPQKWTRCDDAALRSYHGWTFCDGTMDRPAKSNEGNIAGAESERQGTEDGITSGGD